ncbi:MAG: HlyD family secretion protein [Pseudomonadota bacterium]|nr:HlyD family secretion protein [Pseudomonadota bacterium]
MISSNKKYLYSFLPFLAIVVLVVLFKAFRLSFPKTDDAYLKAHIVDIAPRLTAPIADINIKENQFVKKGVELLRLDQSVYLTQLRAAEAAFENSLEISKASEAALNRSIKDLERIKSLYSEGLVSDSKYLSAITLNREMQAARDSANSQGRLAKANLDEAQLRLSFTKLVSPANGWISNFDLRLGMIVQADKPIFSIIEDKKWWVEANFKETQMRNIRIGQPATLSVDMFPNLKLKGVVESMGAGSGVTFSLLPPQNSTGNWVKITQRFPVKVSIDNAPKTAINGWNPLKVGSSVVVTIDARNR